MPHQLIWEKDGVISRYNGDFTPDVHTEGINSLFSNEKIDNIKYIIADYSQVKGDFLSEQNAEYSAALTTGAASFLKDVKVALVTTDPKILDLCNYYKKLSDQVNPTWEIKIFTTLNTAKQWVFEP